MPSKVMVVASVTMRGPASATGWWLMAMRSASTATPFEAPLSSVTVSCARVDPGVGEGARDLRAVHRLGEVGEVPAVGGDRPVAVEGGGGREADLVAGRRGDVGAGLGDRRRIDEHRGLGMVEGLVLPGIVADGELDGIGARLVEGVARDLAARRRAVAEVPFVGRRSCRPDRASALPWKVSVSPGAATRSGPASAIGRALTTTCIVSSAVLRIVSDASVTVSCHVIGAGLGIDVGRRRPVAGPAVAEVPGVDRDAVVGVAPRPSRRTGRGSR